jgi:hypothetical protein
MVIIFAGELAALIQKHVRKATIVKIVAICAARGAGALYFIAIIRFAVM